MDTTDSKYVVNRYSDNRTIAFACVFSDTYLIYYFVASIIISVTAIGGNTLILLSLYKCRRIFKGSIYSLIGNLAAADLLMGCVMLLYIVEYIYPEVRSAWSFCVARTTGIMVAYVCSLISLQLISIDRFMAIVFPLIHFWKSRQKWLRRGRITLAWLTASLVGCLEIVFTYINHPAEGQHFVCRIGAMIPYTIDIVLVSIFSIMTVFNTVLYGTIFWTLQRRPFQGQAPKQRHKTMRKTKMMICVFILFTICWTPFVVCDILPFINRSFTQKSTCWKLYLVVLGKFNSAMNWILYGVSDPKFRQAFKKMLLCNGAEHVLSNLSSIPQQQANGKCSVATDGANIK